MDERDSINFLDSGTDVPKFLARISAHAQHALALTNEFDMPYAPAASDLARIFVPRAVLQIVQNSRLPSTSTAPAEAYVVFTSNTLQPKDAARSIARWMGGVAIARGLPPELPVMATLTESAIRNLSYGDRDSVGYFQIRVSIHGPAAVATPEAQLNWFLSTASRAPVSKKAKQKGWSKELFLANIQQAQAQNLAVDAAYWLGAWCQDAERSAYPDRYEKNYAQARKLLYSDE